jgi:hypothetical protein
MPRQLLNTRIQDVMSTDVFALNFTVEDDIVNVQSVMLDVIASQLNVAKSVISDVKITTVERTTSVSVPLVQISFNLSKSSEAKSLLMKQVDSSDIKGTIKVVEFDSFYNIRINL